MMKERELSTYFIKKLKKFECVTIKLTTLRKYGAAGWPDWLVVIRRSDLVPEFRFVELKTETGTLTVIQDRRQEQLLWLGCSVVTLYGKEEVDTWLRSLATLYPKAS